MYSNNNKSVMYLPGANSISPFDSLKNQNDLLMKRLDMIETLSFNMNALQQTVLNHIEETKKRDYCLLQLIDAVKKDQQLIIAEKIVQIKENNHIKFNTEDFNNFFTTEHFTMFMKKYLSHNCSMNDYL
jgi:hypothetical protein